MASLTPDDLQRLLSEGIAAAKRGDKQRAMQLLVQVVEQDQRIEKAWLWLSGVVDDPRDKLVALENALTLNPDNVPARAGIEHLLAQHPELREPHAPAAPPEPIAAVEPAPPAAPPEPELPAWAVAAETGEPAAPAVPPVELAAPSRLDAPVGRPLTPAAAMIPEWAQEAQAPPAAPAVEAAAPAALDTAELARVQIVHEQEEMLRCPYCGRPTRETDTRCPRCRQSLMISRRAYEEPSSNLGCLSLIFVMMAARGLLDLAGPMIALWLLGPDKADNSFYSIALPWAFVADPQKHAVLIAAWTQVGYVFGRSVVYLVVAWGLSRRMAIFYYPILVVAIIDLVFSVIALIQGGFGIGEPVMALRAGFSLVSVLINVAAVFFLAGAWPDFQSKRERILCMLDRDANDPAEQSRRGHLYRKHKLWGLAAVHYGAAAAGMPDSLEYAKNYVIALSETGRDEQALEILRARRAQFPKDLQLPAMIELLQQKIEKKSASA